MFGGIRPQRKRHVGLEEVGARPFQNGADFTLNNRFGGMLIFNRSLVLETKFFYGIQHFWSVVGIHYANNIRSLQKMFKSFHNGIGCFVF